MTCEIFWSTKEDPSFNFPGADDKNIFQKKEKDLVVVVRRILYFIAQGDKDPFSSPLICKASGSKGYLSILWYRIWNVFTYSCQRTLKGSWNMCRVSTGENQKKNKRYFKKVGGKKSPNRSQEPSHLFESGVKMSLRWNIVEKKVKVMKCLPHFEHGQHACLLE